jgi:anti-sigma regulatory factor (Ser/Thr protein kinase)
MTNLTAGPDVPVVRSFRAHPSALHEVRDFVRDLVQGQRFPPAIVDDMVLAVSEAAANVIVHTNSPMIELAATATAAQIEIQVRDTGIFRRRLPMPELNGHGRGVPLMMAVTDEMDIKLGTPIRPGTVVKLVKYRDP